MGAQACDRGVGAQRDGPPAAGHFVQRVAALAAAVLWGVVRVRSGVSAGILGGHIQRVGCDFRTWGLSLPGDGDFSGERIGHFQLEMQLVGLGKATSKLPVGIPGDGDVSQVGRGHCWPG